MGRFSLSFYHFVVGLRFSQPTNCVIIRSFCGLVEMPDHSSMLCGIFPNMWMDFQ
jgi:hypothetical protein